MPKKKKEALPTYTVLIRTPAGTQTIIETNDFAKARRTYAQYKGSCRLCIDGRELRILEADKLMDDHNDKVMEQIFIPRRTKKTEDIHALKSCPVTRAGLDLLPGAAITRSSIDRVAAGAANG